MKLLKLISFFTLLFLSISSTARIYRIHSGRHDVVGRMRTVITRPGDTIDSLARQYNVSYMDIFRVNPELDATAALLPFHKIIIPSQHILPPGPREGIVINLPEMKLYYYLSENQVMVAPIGIGREGWMTPLGKTYIAMKIKDPSWTPTPKVREDAKRVGKILPNVMPAGPDNPLGKFALLLGWKTFLVHGTNHPEGVGKRSSAGCFRMYPEDIALLFEHVTVGTPVTVLNHPVKIGWKQGGFFLQAYPSLRDYPPEEDPRDLVGNIKKEQESGKLPISWEYVMELLNDKTGVPSLIGEQFVVDAHQPKRKTDS